jgi:hypothetical protein
VDPADFREAGDAFDGVTLAYIDGLDRIRENAEVIGRGDADAGVTVVDAEGGVRGR